MITLYIITHTPWPHLFASYFSPQYYYLCINIQTSLTSNAILLIHTLLFIFKQNTYITTNSRYLHPYLILYIFITPFFLTYILLTTSRSINYHVVLNIQIDAIRFQYTNEQLALSQFWYTPCITRSQSFFKRYSWCWYITKQLTLDQQTTHWL